MAKPAQTSKNKQVFPVLIVDRVGVVGEGLAKKISSEALIVFVSQKKPDILENIAFVPYNQNFPAIPDNVYSHIFVVDDFSHSTKEAMPAFLKKAQNDKAAFVFVSDVNNSDQDFVSDITAFYKNSKVVLYADVFGADYQFFGSLANRFLYQAQTKGRIEVPGDGTGELFPVYFEDLILGILEVTFGSNSNEKIFYLFAKHTITYLSFAHMLQKANPSLKIDFVKEEVHSQKKPVSEGYFLFGSDYSLEKRIRKLSLAKEEDKKENVQKKIEDPQDFYKKKSLFYTYFWIFIVVALFILLPLLSTLAFSFIGKESLVLAKTQLDKGDFSKAIDSASVAKDAFFLARQTSAPLSFEADLVGLDNQFSSLRQRIEDGENIASATTYLFDSAKLLSGVFLGKSKNPQKDFSQGSNNLKNALVIFQKEKLKTELFAKISPKTDFLTNFVSATVDVWPEIFGINSKKTYLVLFQNNMELRPGGGFIGSYGILTINKGKITDFKIHDVYDADGQLKVHVEPPFPIRRYLESPHWYLRDSNFDISFAKAAASSAYFLDLETGQKVDGVVGVDVSFVKNLLAAIGPVKVSDYNQTVNSENLFKLTEEHAEKNFFPGSNQKKNFLKSLFNAILLEISSDKKIPYASLAENLGKSIEEKHILFAFNNVGVQSLFSVNNWSSSILKEDASQPSVINDFAGINEANLGANKANYFVKRKITQNVFINQEGDISGQLTIAYENLSKSRAWPGGDYKNYLRVILPLGSTIKNIEIDGKEQKIINAVMDPSTYEKKDFAPPVGLELEKTDEQGKTVYGFLIMIPYSSQKTIKVSYDLLQKAEVNMPDFSYKLTFFKQPGTDNYPYNFVISYPPSLGVIESSAEITKTGTKAGFALDLNKDLSLFLKLAQK